MSHDHFPPADG